MTGIGFLGAGVIFKEGLSVRGLTTAASVWITAAIGILIGVGFYRPAIIGTLLALGTLSLFRRIEERIPSRFFAHHHIRFENGFTMPEADLRRLLADEGFTIANLSQQLTDDQGFEYRMVLRTTDLNNLSRLSVTLRQLEHVRAFGISPTGD